MYKLIVLGMALACFSQIALADDAVLCLKNVEVSIKERSTVPFHFADDSNRKMKIALRMPADCKDGSLLEPSSFTEAQDWLDLALPFDFKKGMTAGEYLNPYKYTPYGFSVDGDLYDYFTAQWKLRPESAICKNAPPDPDTEKGGNTCFFQLIDSIRAQYKNPMPISP